MYCFRLVTCIVAFGVLAGCGGGSSSGSTLGGPTGDDASARPGTGGPSGTGGTSSADKPPSESPRSLGTSYFFLYEDEDGVVRPGSKTRCGAPLSFGSWSTLLSPTHLEIATTLPSDLDPYQVIAIGGLGAKSKKGLDATKQAALREWIDAGGTLLVIADYEWSEEQKNANATLNALVTSLGGHITLNGPLQRNGSYSLELDSKSPLSTDASELPCGSGTLLTLAPPAVAVDAEPKGGMPVLAAEALGNGRVVVLADQTCLSDYRIAVGTPPLYEDCALGPNAASVGAFLKNLATSGM